MPRASRLLSLAAVAVINTAAVASAATFTLVSMDAAGVGFNDPSPRAPLGGNAGATLGEQRRIAFQHAADLWGARLYSHVAVRVAASFVPLSCSSTQVVLGTTIPVGGARDFTGAPVAATYYPYALANALAGIDLDPSADDILAFFSNTLGETCAFPGSWYYGLDGNVGANQIDLVSIALHELGHGLGFVAAIDPISGAKFNGFDDAFMRSLENHNTLKLFPTMTDAERVAACIADGALHWVGESVVAAGATLTAGVGPLGHVEMYAPNPLEFGSSVGHFSDSLQPEELMQPFYMGPNHKISLTAPALEDVGWTVVPCDLAPKSGCQPAAARKASLTLKNTTPDTKDQLKWAWKGTTTIAKTDFGTPTATATYGVCVYDSSGGGGAMTLKVSTFAPPGGTCAGKPCWKESASGFTYADKALTPTGVANLSLKSGTAAKAKLTVTGKGATLALPQLPLTLPVTVQLMGSDSPGCWEATFSSASKNDATQVKAKSQ